MSYIEGSRKRMDSLSSRLSPVVETLGGILLFSTASSMELKSVGVGLEKGMRSYMKESQEGGDVVLPYITYPMAKGLDLGYSPITILTTYFTIGGAAMIHGIRGIKQRWGSKKAKSV